MSQQLSTNTFGTAKFIVDSSASQGTHTTIASALTSASSGDTIFIRPGTYTENLTLKAGVNLSAYASDAFTPNVTISGTSTFTAAGTVSISGIRLQSNGAEFLSVTGSAASIVNLINCYLTTAFDPGITFSSSSASAKINIINCQGNISAAATKLFAHSSAGSLEFDYSMFSNSGGSSTASTCSAGNINALYTEFLSPITTSGTSGLAFEHCLIDTSVQNATSMTLGGSSTQNIKWTRFNSGTASAVSISTAATLNYCTVSSSNTNAVTGAGTISYGSLAFESTSSTINTTTQTPLVHRFGEQRSTTHPAFLASAALQSNVTGDNTLYTVTFTTAEIFDQNNNFDGTSTFTAPVTGRYQLNTNLVLNDVGVAHTGGIFIIVTSNRSYYFSYSNIGVANFGGVEFGVGSVLADMDAADTATITIQISGGTKVVDVNALSFFSGNLFC